MREPASAHSSFGLVQDERSANGICIAEDDHPRLLWVGGRGFRCELEAESDNDKIGVLHA